MGSILSARCPYVALTGPSGSGKTTTAFRLKAYLENLGVEVILLSMDNFFLEAQADWESPLCVDVGALIQALDSLHAGEKTKIPWYDFTTGKRGGWNEVQGSRDAVIIAEGIHMLNPLIFDSIRHSATGIYVAPRTRVITDDDRIVKPEQIRVARRLLRDLQGRGHSLQATVERAQSVDRGEQVYIAPCKANATVHIDSFHDYELCLLAQRLRNTPDFDRELSPAFMEAHGLSVLYDVIHELPPLNTRYVPRDSLVREFVGGSLFAY